MITLGAKMSYVARRMPRCLWETLRRRAPSGRIHLIVALADHFEPSINPQDFRNHVPLSEQQRRLEMWCREYPRVFSNWRDHEGRPFVHTYFYPAEQYERVLIEKLAEHCRGGWGEVEIHLHHGLIQPDTAENTRRVLQEFRDVLAFQHGCLSYDQRLDLPRYVFVHGNFSLANTNGGRFCGVDSEMQVLADTGCFADMTMPPAPFHRAQTAKMNSLYECDLPLLQKGAHERGRDLESGNTPTVFPLMVQGPLLADFGRPARRLGIENGAITHANPLSIRRLGLWKKASIRVKGRPDWLFVKLHCHSMDPRHLDVVLGTPMQEFVKELVEGAGERREVLHFVSAREMVNIMLAACDGRDGNPGEYRDYRFKRGAARTAIADPSSSSR